MLFVAVVFLGLNLKLFTIKQIEVQKNNLGCVNEDQLKVSSGLLGKNFFSLDKEKLVESLKEQFICVKNIKISRLFPSGVKIEVSPREPAVILLALKNEATNSALLDNIATPSADQIKDSFIADNEGVTFSKEISGLDIPKIYFSELEKYLVQNSIKILDKIKTLGVKVRQSLIKDVFLVINPFDNEPKIIFRLDKKIDIQIASLQLILTEAKINKEIIEFIDLRFDKPVVRFAPKKK